MMEDYSITYNTIRNTYSQIAKAKIPVHMVGGISAAIQTGVDLYRKNSDLDLMVDKQNLQQLLDILTKLGYQIEDKRGILTDNFIDKEGNFHTCCHDINANINSSQMLGIGIFVYERTNESIIRSTYNYDQRSSTFNEIKSVIPIELFDLTYDQKEITYKDIQVRCQTKEATYLSKSKGNRDKDKQDATVLKEYIGPEEEKRISRIKKLEKRIEQYQIIYDKNGNIISSKKVPSTEDKIKQFMSEIILQNPARTNEEIKNIVLNDEFVKMIMEDDEDIRNILKLWQATQIDGDIAEAAKILAHNYYFKDEQPEKKSWELDDDTKLEVNNKTAKIANKYNSNNPTIINKEKGEELK